MTSPQVPAALRRLVRERAALQCEYCLAPGASRALRVGTTLALPEVTDPVVAESRVLESRSPKATLGV